MKRIVLAVVLIAFLALTVAAAWQHGYMSIFAYRSKTWQGYRYW